MECISAISYRSKVKDSESLFIDILPNLIVYINSVKNQKPLSDSFKVVEEHCHNPLLGAKLALFKTIAFILNPGEGA